MRSGNAARAGGGVSHAADASVARHLGFASLSLTAGFRGLALTPGPNR
jgi:hypothetical protein